MKKILLLTLPVMALCLASCEKNNGDELSGDDVIQFQDPNFLKALLYVQGGYIYDAETDDFVNYLIDVDTDKDGKITVNEAKKVRALVLSYESEDGEWMSYDIERMPEIKYFSALEFLDCYDNRLTSLDLINCTALTWLDCYDNQLASLDVSDCTALLRLDCDDNGLISLDLGNNTALEFLSCYNNQLTSLDLSNNTALIQLSCDNNQLTSLNLSNCAALMELSCSGNPLTKIILNKNHMLDEYFIQSIIEEYGDIIEYVE